LKKYFSFFLIATQIFCGHVIKAQATDSVKITGQVSGENGEKVITEFTKVYLNPMDPEADYFSATVDAQGTFTLMVPIHVPTMYMFKYRDYKMEVLLCPSEPEFKIAVTADNRSIKNMRVVDSREYEAYRNFKKAVRGFREKLPGFIAGGSEQLKRQIDTQNELLDYLSHKYQGTYTAQILIPMAQMPDINTSQPPQPQMRLHYFDKANVADTLLYRTVEFASQVSVYMNAVADTTAAGRLAFINMLTARAKSNLVAEKDLLLVLLGNFMEEKREDYLQSLVQWASTQNLLSGEQPVLSAKIQLVGKSLPGAKAPQIAGNDVNGHALALTDVLGKNKLTLAVFWSSDCPHCKMEMPHVVELYQKYRDKGLDIFAASTEPHEEKWKQYVANNKLTWYNIKLSEESPAHADYFIQFTPTFVLIDSKGIILRRYIGMADLDGIIGKLLDSK
jgi:thiol-disulfide isomerase/thioredoxin